MPVKCTCKQCGKEFTTYPCLTKGDGRGQFCSNACKYKSYSKPKIDAVCMGCGKTFAISSNEIARGNGKFCSRKCSDAAKYTGGASGSRDRVWKQDHISPIRFKPISTEELNKILSGDDKE